MVETSETKGFKVFALIASAFFTGVFIACVSYFYKLNSESNFATLSRFQVVSMMWITGILAAVSLALFIYALYLVLATKKLRKSFNQWADEEGSVYGLPGEKGIYHSVSRSVIDA